MIGLLYCLFGSFWRRCFGDDGFGLPILKIRAVQHAMGFIATFCVLFHQGVGVVQGIIACALYYGLYWARSHGCCFDFGHFTPNEKRYNQLWYWKYVKKIIPESQWYSFTGDFILMVVRYTLPAILIAITLLNPLFCFMGLVLSCVYANLWLLHDWYGIKSPTAKAEWIVGFTSSLFFVM